MIRPHLDKCVLFTIYSQVSQVSSELQKVVKDRQLQSDVPELYFNCYIKGSEHLGTNFYLNCSVKYTNLSENVIYGFWKVILHPSLI